MTGAFGIGITQLPAFTAGIASLPTPITEADDENWLFHTFFAVAPPAGGETWGDSGSAMLRVEVDSKAMRKMATDKALYAAVEVEAENGTIELAVYFDSRVLYRGHQASTNQRGTDSSQRRNAGSTGTERPRTLTPLAP
jgi:hypothetical protein